MPNIYEEIGVNPVINAYGNRTLLGGNTPSAEVRALMDESEGYYANMGELTDKVGERIAEMLGVEAATVTSGTAAALTIAAAGCMTGTDVARVEQLPDTTGMPNEFIIQKRLRINYDRTMTIAGGKLIEVGDADGTRPEHIEQAIGPNTAGVHYLATSPRPGVLPLEDVISIAHSRDVPVIVDAAGQVYPTESLSKFAKMGADLVAYGAKYFGAVNSSGMLTGKKEMIEAARMNSFIYFESTPTRALGRPMKMDRQEVVAVYAALRVWLTMNHEDRFAENEVRIARIWDGLRDISGFEKVEDSNSGPPTALWITVDPDQTGMIAADIADELKAGDPCIWVRDEDGDRLGISVPTLREEFEQVVVDRIREIVSA